jgi:hypothetical protein
MDLGSLEEFRYEPEFRGNRNLPAGERVSVMVKRLTALDVLQDLTPEQLLAWRDKAFRRWAVTKKDGDSERVVGFEGVCDGLDLVPTEMLAIFRRVITHTHGYRNITFSGQDVTDPAEIFLRTRMPDSLNQKDNLLLELYNTLRETAGLSDDDLGNWLTPSGGGNTPQNTSVEDAEEGAPQRSATEGEAQTAS